MSAYHSLDEFLHGLRGAQARFERSLEEACREAAELSVRMPSSDGTVEVIVHGDCSLGSVVIDDRGYRRHDAGSLRAAILDAYQRAVFELSRQQHATVLRTVAPNA